MGELLLYAAALTHGSRGPDVLYHLLPFAPLMEQGPWLKPDALLEPDVLLEPNALLKATS